MIPGYFKPLSKFYYNAVKQLSPYAYWRMNEKTGTQALDSSGNNFTGTYTNATLDQSALVLNNSQQSSVLYTTAKQSYLNFGVNSNLSNFNRSVTFSLWVSFTAINSSPHCFYSSGLYGFCFRQTNGGIEILRDYSVSIGTIACNFAINTIYHVVVQISTAGIVSVYSNSVLQGTLDVSSYTFSANSGVNIALDTKQNTPVSDSSFFDGYMQEFSIFQSVLSAAQIQNLYKIGSNT